MSEKEGTDEDKGDEESDLTITEWKVEKIEKEKEKGKQQIVLVHGLWL